LPSSSANRLAKIGALKLGSSYPSGGSRLAGERQGVEDVHECAHRDAHLDVLWVM
jgi:hypothetical protein